MDFRITVLRGIFFTFLLAGPAALAGSGTIFAQGSSYPAHPPKVFSSGLFPCSQCHGGMPVNTQKRELSFHDDIHIIGHGEPRRWCLDCHAAEDRDRLKLPGGETVSFGESHLLCGQCHGNIFKAWKAGIHGKRTGMWDGLKQYFLCSSCHSPHSPRFRPVRPEKPPLRPEETLRR